MWDHPHFRDDETRAPAGKVRCPTSHSGRIRTQALVLWSQSFLCFLSHCAYLDRILTSIYWICENNRQTSRGLMRSIFSHIDFQKINVELPRETWCHGISLGITVIPTIWGPLIEVRGVRWLNTCTWHFALLVDALTHTELCEHYEGMKQNVLGKNETA